MYKLEKELRVDSYKNPSFSSILLDEICRSMGEGEGDLDHQDLKLYSKETMAKKQSFSKGASLKPKNRAIKEEAEEERQMSALRRACLVEKWMEKKVNEKVLTQQKKKPNQLEHFLDQDSLFFSSTSTSSESSSGPFSSSDTEFAPPRPPKPIRTGGSCYFRRAKTEEKQRKTENTLFYEQSEVHMFNHYSHNNSGSKSTSREEDILIKSKLRALKIYNNLKKVKQPISPGGKLASFINSLFTTGQRNRNLKSPVSSTVTSSDQRNLKSGEVSSTCSSASSFSKSCLSKNSPSTREKFRNGAKRNVTFDPVSVIVDDDYSKPCGHKNLYKKGDMEKGLGLMPVFLPKEWRIGKLPAKKVEEEEEDEEVKLFQVVENSTRVEEMVDREFFKEHRHQNLKKSNDAIARDVRGNHCNNKHNNVCNYDYDDEDDDDDEEDDDASYSSSDLFELDHLAVMGNDGYCQELPVYETTNVSTNRAIASGFMV